MEVEYLVVGGGGGGGSAAAGGGGGGGGVKTATGFAVTETSYSITVGAGGAKSDWGAFQKNNGGNSVFDTITATGGGAGGTQLTQDGNSGGSGGGGAGLDIGGVATPSVGGTSTAGQGNDGGDGKKTGTSTTRSYAGGGGGGAGAVGADGNASSAGGAGGDGTTSSISGSSVYYGGGGGGGFGRESSGATGSGGSGGLGGGGNGSNVGTTAGGTGTANTGGGGGGSGYNASLGSSGAGGSGIVIIRYKTDGSDGISTSSTGGTITTSGLYTIHTFTSSGTFTVVASHTHTATVTIDNTKVSADLTDFPIYIDLSDMPASFWSSVADGGGDIRVFKSDDTTELPREVVSCATATETGELHVKYSGTLSSSTDTVLHIYTNGVSADYAATATYGRNAVWSGHGAVWHLDDTADSTATGATLTNNNSVAFNSGKIEDGADFGSSNTNKTLTTTSHGGLAAGDARTISMWVNITTAPASGDTDDIFGMSDEPEDVAYLLEYQNNGGTLRLRVGRARYYVDDPTLIYNTTLTTGTWYYLTYTIDASRNQVLYLNGTSVASNTAVSGNGAGAVFDGCYFARAGFAVTRLLNGEVDEARLAAGVRSADWITTEYNNQSVPSTFYAATDPGGATGYANTVMGVASANIGKVMGVATANISKVMGV